MFAVPGWSIDSSSIAQEQGRAKADDPVSVSKKRKSSSAHGHQASKVSGNELEKLWSQRNGAKPVKSDKISKREKSHKKQDAVKGQSIAGRSERGKREKPEGEHKVSKNQKSATQPSSTTAPRPTSQRERSADKPKPKKSRDGHVNHQSKTIKTLLQDEQPSTFPHDAIKALPPTPPAPSTLTPLQVKMRSKLTSARFRHLNETLYTTSSTAAMDLFSTSPDLFAEYHAGFSQQVKDSWPTNPVDKYVSDIKTRGALQAPTTLKGSMKSTQPLPRRPKTGTCTIADLGCGDAPLARGTQSQIRALSLKFHNFDLHAPNSLVTKADISNLPLRDGEVDIAVFCLSLMGTNWISFVEEAWRVLRGDGKGEIWVSEVKSRFGRVGRRKPGEAVDNSVGKRRKPQNTKKSSKDDQDDVAVEGIFLEDADPTPNDETDLTAFIRVFGRRGFQLREDSIDKSNKMFVSMVFVKSGIPTAGKHKGLKWMGREYKPIDDSRLLKGKGNSEKDEATLEEEKNVLKPCVYKTR